jgi:tetratricopeptide (TPR) repeat protein
VQPLLHDKTLRARALIVVGDAYTDLQATDKARHAYEDAAKADPQSADAAFKVGRALHDAGRQRPAVAALERAVSLGGDKAGWAAEAWLFLGDAHREQHEKEAAIAAYRRYLILAPPDAPARAEVNRQLSLLGGR